MPTVFRFLTLLLALAAIVYAAMFLLATLVEPRQREMSVDVPLKVTPAPPAIQQAPAEETIVPIAPAGEQPPGAKPGSGG